MSRKRPKKAPRSPKFCVDRLATAIHQKQAISLATWLKPRIRGLLIHPQSPTFCGFHPSELPKQTPRPPYLGPVGRGKLQAQTETGWCPNGSTGSSRGRKLTFLKNDPRPCVMLKQVSLDCFELGVARFGPPKIPKCLENGLFWDQKWVKNGSKTHFSKTHRRPFGVHQRVNRAHFGGILAPQKSKKALKVGLVVKGITCKPNPLCQRPSMCNSLVSLTIHRWRQSHNKNRPYLWLHGSNRDSEGT